MSGMYCVVVPHFILLDSCVCESHIELVVNVALLLTWFMVIYVLISFVYGKGADVIYGVQMPFIFFSLHVSLNSPSPVVYSW